MTEVEARLACLQVAAEVRKQHGGSTEWVLERAKEFFDWIVGEQQNPFDPPKRGPGRPPAQRKTA